MWAKRARVGEDFGKQNSFSSYLIRTAGAKEAKALRNSTEAGSDADPLGPQAVKEVEHARS